MKVSSIVKGQRVAFENAHGPQTSTVLHVTRDVGNRQPYAVVQVEDDPLLDGIVVSVPLDDLHPEAAT